jgi:UDP-N-acetylglucosamine acyltransferase
MANSVALGGHIVIEDYAILGGIVAVHQFVRIGAYAIVGGMTGVSMDIPPYVSASGGRAQLYGLNLVGLKRRGFSEEAINTLKKVYKVIFRSGLTQEEAFRKVQAEYSGSREAMHFIEFMKSSKRGVTR